MIYSLFKLARPYQWTKNVFVFTGLLFGHGWNKPPLIIASLLAFAAFCLVSSGVYILNDIVDREADRNHPEKKNRPLASGALSLQIAFIFLALIWGGGFTLAFYLSKTLAAILGVYVVMNIAYSLRLKHEPVLDVFLLAAGFVLRILGGTLGLGIPPSDWLILTGTAISLFLGFVKRRAELMRLKEGSSGHRKVLAFYDPRMLDGAIIISATVAIVAYGLYALSDHAIRIHGTRYLIHTVPLVMYGIFRYLFLLYSEKGGGDPSKDLIRDPHILIAGLLWVGVTLALIA